MTAPRGPAIRPTLDRVREALFSILMPRIPGARFLDLFAGTGANGIEALSRGAAWCTFVDNAPAAIATVTHNLEAARLDTHAECLRLSLPEGLGAVSPKRAPYGVVFADPPYAFTRYGDLARLLRDMSLVEEGGLLVLEHAATTDLGEELGGLKRFRTAHYGDTDLSFFS